MEIRIFRALALSAFLVLMVMIAVDHEGTWYYAGAAVGCGLVALLLWHVDSSLTPSRRDSFPESTTNGHTFGDPAAQQTTEAKDTANGAWS